MLLEILHLFLIGISFLVLFFLGESLYHKFSVRGQDSRRMIHLITGLIILSFPTYLKEWGSVALICGGFIFILWISKKYNFIKSIHDVDRKSVGTFFYPVMIFIIFMVFYCFDKKGVHDKAIFYLPMMILGICDPLASFIGSKFGKNKLVPRLNNKTLEGSLAFGIGALLITFFVLGEKNLSSYKMLLNSITIALCSTIAELIAKDGWDNFTIPLVVLVLYLSLFIF